MSTKNHSAATLSSLIAVLLGSMVLAGCKSTPITSSTPTPSAGIASVGISVSSLTFSSTVGAASAPQSVTVTNTNTGTAALTFSGISTTNSVFTENNTCSSSLAAGSNCTITVTFTPTAAGTVTGSLTINDSATGSPQTVSLTGAAPSTALLPATLTFSGATLGIASAAQAVTFTNASTAGLSVSSITVTAGFSETNNCGSSVAASSNCAINVTFLPTVNGTTTGTLSVVDGAGTQTVSLTGSTIVPNTVPVSVNFGPNGYQGPPSSTYKARYNGIYTTVTVCEPDTTTCVTVPNVLVDTGSVGLRVLSSALTGVTLTQLNDGNGNNLNECTTNVDGSFNWGPVSLASVQIGAETASQVPAASGGTANSGIAIQIISTNTVPKAVLAAGQCVNSATSPDEDTVATLGANGILGIGTEPQDCAIAGVNYCTTAASAGKLPVYPYWYCSAAGACAEETVPLPNQVWNPVAAFSSTDTNGVQLTLPSLPAAGQATVAGTLTFGIGTQSDNPLPSGVTVYELSPYGPFLPEATFNGVNYFGVNSQNQTANPTFLDSRSGAFVVSDASTLTSATGVSTVLCSDGSGFYCPASALTLNLTLYGSNGTQGTVTLSIANADSLFSANPSFAAFNNIGVPSSSASSTDYFDLGLPFFFGKTIAVGIAGGTTYPNGYWAF